MSEEREIGGWNETFDWPKIGPSLLIASCLVLAIRTAKRPALWDQYVRDVDLDKEGRFSIFLAEQVLSSLLSKKESLFPKKRTPWYQPSEEDSPQ